MSKAPSEKRRNSSALEQAEHLGRQRHHASVPASRLMRELGPGFVRVIAWSMQLHLVHHRGDRALGIALVLVPGLDADGPCHDSFLAGIPAAGHWTRHGHARRVLRRAARLPKVKPEIDKAPPVLMRRILGSGLRPNCVQNRRQAQLVYIPTQKKPR